MESCGFFYAFAESMPTGEDIFWPNVPVPGKRVASGKQWSMCEIMCCLSQANQQSFGRVRRIRVNDTAQGFILSERLVSIRSASFSPSRNGRHNGCRFSPARAIHRCKHRGIRAPSRQRLQALYGLPAIKLRICVTRTDKIHTGL